MNIQRWVGRREHHWRQLDALLKRVEKRGLRTLKAAEIRLMASLYRSVSADLARARTQQAGVSLVRDLQTLTTRAYNQIYQGSRRHEWRSAVEFYLWGFPAAVQRAWGYIALATAVFVLGGLISWWFAWQDPSFMALVVPDNLIVQVRDRQELWMGKILGNEPESSSGIMVNNLVVSFRAIAGGISFGLFTLFVLFLNGVFMGAIAALVGQNGLAYPFWAFVLPHGSLELPAIFLAGGAGLLIARALVFPGRYRRVDAFKVYGAQAAQLTFGIVPLLVIAGIIEGFFSPNPQFPDGLKYVVGAALFLAFLLYCSVTPPPNHDSHRPNS